MIRHGLFWFLLMCILVVIFALIALSQAKAHGWYESSCCSERDCREVKEGAVVEKSDGVHVEGHGVLSRSDSRIRWSRDDKDHVCEQVTPGLRGVTWRKLLCVYMKPNGM